MNNEVFRETLLTLIHGPAHMERVYNGGSLHAQTASALWLKALVVFTQIFYSWFKDKCRC